jgi:hypothetical protein
MQATDHHDWIEPAERKYWLGLRTLVEITTSRELKTGTASMEKRYYPTSRAAEAEELLGLVRPEPTHLNFLSRKKSQNGRKSDKPLETFLKTNIPK